MSFIKSHKIHTFLLITAILLAVFIGISVVKAAAPAGYPVKSLDNCQNKEECQQVCLDNLGEYPTKCLYYFFEVDTELLQRAKEILNEGAEVFAREGGPNGCGTDEQCEDYCSNEDNYPECQAYYMGPLSYWTNSNITNIAPLWAGKIIPAVITAMEENIEPPIECRNTYYNDHLSCIFQCPDSTDADGNLIERSESCTKYLTDTGYFSQDDFELEAKLKELAKKGETGGCEWEDITKEEGLRSCFDINEFSGLCAPSNDPVACFALADKYDLAPEEDIEIGKLVAPFLKSGQTPGKCANLRECQTYCSNEANYDECTKFADKFDLPVEVPDEQKDIVAAIEKGDAPGGCTDEVSCRVYCEDVDHLVECVDFVEKFKLASSDELKEMRQMADIKKAGVPFPGNCKTKESCLKYCDNSANAVVCMEFAQKAGFIPKEDAEAVGKILPYLKSGGKLPGGCTTKKSCDAYCESDANTIECVDFAVKAGFMDKEEADIVKKVGGKGPGNCRSREACDSYCKSDANINECVDFAVKAGFISKEDAEMAKKFGITSGPDNCKSKAECEAFCVLPENQETCFNFAKDHGMLSEEDLKNIEEQKKFLESIDKATPEWLACMEKELGPSFFGRFKAGKLTQAEAKSSVVETAQRKCAPDIRKETEACLALSCSEFDACLKSLGQVGGESGGKQQQEQGTPDPKITAKIQACQKEKINVCLAKSCGEFQACLNALGGGGGGGTPDPAVQAKFMSCFPPPPSGGGQQQYPLLLPYQPFAAILNFILGR